MGQEHPVLWGQCRECLGLFCAGQTHPESCIQFQFGQGVTLLFWKAHGSSLTRFLLKSVMRPTSGKASHTSEPVRSSVEESSRCSYQLQGQIEHVCAERLCGQENRLPQMWWCFVCFTFQKKRAGTGKEVQGCVQKAGFYPGQAEWGRAGS